MSTDTFKLDLLKLKRSDIAASYRALAQIEGRLTPEERKEKARFNAAYLTICSRIERMERPSSNTARPTLFQSVKISQRRHPS